uniref:Uncharacterized protein n=1 Tax=Timema tahoe TaxID=61484 RepID=A0A7R9P098_9NEOP|nr:unnamed protein product [Timema tahoe]
MFSAPICLSTPPPTLPKQARGPVWPHRTPKGRPCERFIEYPDFTHGNHYLAIYLSDTYKIEKSVNMSTS